MLLPIKANAKYCFSNGILLSDPTSYLAIVGSFVYLTITCLRYHMMSMLLVSSLLLPLNVHWVVLCILRYLRCTIFLSFFFYTFRLPHLRCEHTVISIMISKQFCIRCWELDLNPFAWHTKCGNWVLGYLSISHG